MGRIRRWLGSWSAGLSWRTWRLFGFGFLVLLGLALLSTIAMVEISSRPKFCGSCHVMEPYYTSWATSSHKEVACVECHIPPGIYSEIQKKKEALSMVVSYFTGTYGTNPWTEVDDAACLQCHQRRLLAGKVLYKGILFDHGPHLTEMRREKKLRCTSCHSQIVQGSHIAVTVSTCVLCHFKSERLGEDLSRCALCHALPEKVISTGNLAFDHAEVKRFDMQCTWCHAHVTKGDGGASRQRCFVCHSDSQRLAKYADHPELHRIHVTEHKVECLHCHTEIEHANFAGQAEIAGTACNACHGQGHSPQRELYVGIGGRGLPPRPSLMYLAGIHCEGCHFLPAESPAGPVQAASAVSCMACHGPRYSKMLERWKGVIGVRLAQAREELSQARRLLGASQPALADAEANLLLVERGHGVHNVDYALDILRANHGMLDAALKVAGRPSLPASWGAVPYSSPCLRCHQGAENQRGAYQGSEFSHQSHVVRQALDCQRCHRPHEERVASEVVSLPESGCAPCHHTPAVAPGSSCQGCHRRVLDQVLDWQGRQFAHRLHVEEQGLTCLQCHIRQARPGLNPKACADCHD